MQVLCSNGEKKDIIHFYNDVYIKTMKEHIIKMKPDAAAASKTPVINRQPILTP